jgi:endonuclease YncB( thermonuclease family)
MEPVSEFALYVLIVLGVFFAVAVLFLLIINIDNIVAAAELIKDNEPFIIANVTKVIDGDTIDIESGERIRFAIVNTPERGQPGYQEAKQWTTDRCLGKNAVIDLDSAQPPTYGRLVGLVYCYDVEAHFVNLELLQQGLAVVMHRYCEISEFRDGVLCQFQTG